MSNPFYTANGTPGTGSFGASAPMRSEFTAIQAGFALLPQTFVANKAVVMNSSATAMTLTAGSLSLAGDFATVGNFTVSLVAGAAVALTLPVVSGTLATLAGTETLSNKTMVAVALGTPASGILTNCTGYPMSGLVGTLPAANFPALTGDITTALGSLITILATVATGATTGSSTAIPVITFNNKGLVTGVTTAAVVAPAGTLSGATLAANVTASSLTSVGTIATGVWQGTAIGVAYGGTGLTSLGAGVATWMGAPSSANLAAAVTDETGSGALVFATNPTMTLNNATGLPISVGVSGLGTGIAVALGINTGSAGAPVLFNGNGGTPSVIVLTNASGTASGLTAGNATLAATVTTNANLTGPITSSGNATAIASQTGSGTKFVMDTSPTLVTPVLGVATATSINKVAITAPASSATLTLVDGTTVTGPPSSGTMATLAGTETLTNKTLTAVALGTPASGNLVNCTGFPGATSGNGTTFLLANVPISNNTDFFDGPNTGSIGASGQKWLLIANGVMLDAIAANGEIAIWDGSAYIANVPLYMVASNTDNTATAIATVTLSGATTFTLRAKNVTSSTAQLLATGWATGVAQKATSITAVRIS